MAYLHVFPRARAWLGAVLIGLVLGSVAVRGATAGVAELRQSAEAGDQAAMAQLIRQLMRGSDQERHEAFSWLQRLGASGDLDAQKSLAGAYLRGVPALKLAADPVEAEEWFLRAARQSPDALRNLIALYHDKSAPPHPRHIADAMQLVSQLAAAGNQEMQFLAASVMMAGRIVAKDQPGAVKLLRQAAADGHTDSKLALAQALMQGTGVRQDPAEATKWIISAADDGNAQAQYLAGVSYRDGVAVKKDAATAARYFRAAARHGHPEATFEYARALHDGNGVEKDLYSAVSHWARVANKFPEAAYRAGVAYRDGDGAQRDLKKARSFFRQAKEKGYTQAAAALDDLIKRMPVESWTGEDFTLSASDSVRGSDGRFERRFIYQAQPGDQLTVKVDGQITNMNTFEQTPSDDLLLRYDRGDGQWQEVTWREAKLRFDRRARAQFVVTTKRPGQTPRAHIHFTMVTAKLPAPLLVQSGAEQTLERGHQQTFTLWQDRADEVIEIRAESRYFDPFMEVGPSDENGKKFRVTQSNDNGGGGTTALVRYSRGAKGNFGVRVSAAGNRAGGRYRLLITRPLPFKRNTW